MDERAIERRFRAYALALLEWGIAAIVLGAWCVLSWATGPRGGGEKSVWILPSILCFGFAVRAFLVRRDLRSGMHLHTNVAVVCGSVLMALLVASYTFHQSPGPATWISAAFALVTAQAAVAGIVVVRVVPHPGPKDLTPKGERRARQAGWLMRIGVVLAALPAFWIDYDLGDAAPVAIGAAGLGLLWWLGGEAMRGWVDADKARGLAMSMIFVWGWFALSRVDLDPVLGSGVILGLILSCVVSGLLLERVD
jgi:hypothetical protein